jgi:GT2 family glycosyltransferase
VDVGSQMIDTSIIMAHYSEDEARTELALKCIKAVQPYRSETTEFILVCNGFYPELKQYCDQYFEREVDTSPGRSCNIGIKAAKGNTVALICNDVLVTGNWLEECKIILEKYPKYIAVAAYQLERKWHEYPPIDGYCVNTRVGSDFGVYKKEYLEDIGPFDEVNPMLDGSNFLNRRIKKGYLCMMTKKPLAFNMAPRIHSYSKQQAKLGYTYTPDYRDKKWIPDN